ncbi:hypothetical protein BD626DRAFT_231885 [Schizophyllum amplum]|uniref:Uncharacterized protein n=1 Tax=Schizophyllum amplum TaxID=97359 RepID=A0A550BW77_9AGAR|nr:hypothetical protein BD626DRAFT_231885 [Auriculariopsis ampla]
MTIRPPELDSRAQRRSGDHPRVGTPPPLPQSLVGSAPPLPQDVGDLLLFLKTTTGASSSSGRRAPPLPQDVGRLLFLRTSVDLLPRPQNLGSAPSSKQRQCNRRTPSSRRPLFAGARPQASFVGHDCEPRRARPGESRRARPSGGFRRVRPGGFRRARPGEPRRAQAGLVEARPGGCRRG